MLTSTLPRHAQDTEPRFVLDLCRELASDREVTVLAPHAPGAAVMERNGRLTIRRFRYAPERWERLAYDGGIVPKLKAQPWTWLLVPGFVVAQLWAVIRVLRSQPVELIHAHWLIPQGFIARLARILSGRPVPLVCTAHGADVFGLRGALARALQRWVGAGCARVGAVSEALADALVERGIERARIRQLPMGVAVPEQVPAFSTRDPSLVAFAGRIVEKKGVGVLIDAFKLVAARRPSARLCIAGGGPDLPRYREQARELGLEACVEFLGPVPQARIRELFARAAVAVMPSVTAASGDAEGLGLVMLEAMAGGCPVIVTDLPVVRGVIRPGENGLVFPERDSAALARALEDLLADRDRAARLAQCGRQDVESRYAWSAVGAAHRRAYDEAVSAP